MNSLLLSTISGIYRPQGTRIIQTNLRNSYDPKDITSWPQTGTTMYDLGSEGLDMSLLGGMENNYVASGWFDMDGVDDRALSAASNIGGSSISFGMWAYVRSGTTHIVGGRTDNALGGIIVYCVGSNIYVRYKSSSGTNYNATLSSQLNKWTYFCVTYDFVAGTVQFWKGDNTGFSSIYNNSVNPLNSTSLFNEYGALGSLVSTDLIGEFHVYDDALTQPEWLTNFTNTKVRYGL